MISAAHTEKDIELVIDIHKKALVEEERIALSKSQTIKCLKEAKL